MEGIKNKEKNKNQKTNKKERRRSGIYKLRAGAADCAKTKKEEVCMAGIMGWFRRKMNQIRNDNSGVAVVEIILILVVLIALVVVFKDEAGQLVTRIWSAIREGEGQVLE